MVAESAMPLNPTLLELLPAPVGGLVSARALGALVSCAAAAFAAARWGEVRTGINGCVADDLAAALLAVSFGSLNTLTVLPELACVAPLVAWRVIFDEPLCWLAL